MKIGRGLSLTILLICIFLSVQFENVISQASKVVADNYKRTHQIFFNLNNDFENRAQVITTSDAYIIAGRTAVQYISDEGMLLWEKDISSKNVCIAEGDDYFAIAEQKAGDIFLVDSKGNIVTKRYGLGTILSVKCFEDYIAVVKDNQEFLLLDSQLKTLCSTVLPKGTVIDYEVDVKSQNAIIAILDLSRNEYNTKVVLTSFNGTIVGGSNIEKQIAYDVAVFDQQLYVLTDQGISYFGFDGKLTGNYKAKQTISKFILAESPWLFFVPNTGENQTVSTQKNKIVQVATDNKVLQEFKLPIETIKGMYQIGEKLLVYDEKELFILSKEGKMLESYRVKDEIKNVHVISKHSFAIEFINHLDVYNLK